MLLFRDMSLLIFSQGLRLQRKAPQALGCLRGLGFSAN